MTTSSGKVSAMDKLKGLGMKLKDQATDYIKDNPDQIESMKEQAIGALKNTVDKEAEKEEAKLSKDTIDGTETSKFDKYKAEALNALKPQLDKMATEAEAHDDNDHDGIKNDQEDSSSPVANSAVTPPPSSENRSALNINSVQDLVTALLNLMDDSNLSEEEQKKAVNAFNAAFALKHI